MQVRVLGCSGAIARDCRTTAFLIDDDLLVDGVAVSAAALQRPLEGPTAVEVLPPFAGG